MLERINLWLYKARKEHRCNFCNGIIKPGEIYERMNTAMSTVMLNSTLPTKERNDLSEKTPVKAGLKT